MGKYYRREKKKKTVERGRRTLAQYNYGVSSSSQIIFHLLNLLYLHRKVANCDVGGFFSFGSIPSFFLELFLHCSPVAYWAPTDLGSSSFRHIIMPFHTVHGVLKARILKWFAIPFSSGPHSVLSTMT